MLRELKGGAMHHQARQRKLRRRFVRRLIIVCVLIVSLGIVGGLIYTWMMGKRNPVSSSTVSVAPKKAQTTALKYDENAPVGVAIEAMSPPMKAGANASISVKTKPKSACSITVTYKDGQKSTDAGLVPKNADEFGVVMWTWTVEVGRPVGSWPVEVTCAYKDKSGYGKEALVIIPA